MDCGCPEPGPVSSGCNYVIYSGGPIENVYRLVEHAIPADTNMIHGRPQVHPDGSLEFANDPPTLSGYQKKGLRLVPVWPPCVLRMLKVQVIDGRLTIAGVCSHLETTTLGGEVTPEQCEQCPIRQAS